jgi:hypothetical protein
VTRREDTTDVRAVSRTRSRVSKLTSRTRTTYGGDFGGFALVRGDPEKLGRLSMGPRIPDIAIGLGGLNDSGYTGVATSHDNGDSTVKVAVYITTGHAMMMEEPVESMAP